MKKILAVFLTMVVSLSLFAVNASAATDDLYIGEIMIPYPASYSRETWSFDGNNSTLTLTGAQISGGEGGIDARSYNHNLTINFTGTNTLTGDSFGFHGNYNEKFSILIQGEGSLTFSGRIASVIGVSDVTISGGTVNVISQDYDGLRGSDGSSLTITGNSTLHVESTGCALDFGSDALTIGEGLGITTPAGGSVGQYYIIDHNGKMASTVTIEPAYNVTFYANNGSGRTDTQAVPKDREGNLMTNVFTYKGHTFTGWNTEADGSGDSYEEGAAVLLSADTALYAQWSINKYDITFVNADGTELQSSQVTYGQTPSYTGQAPTQEADAQYTYTFAGWEGEDENVYADDLPAVSDAATYTAVYTSTVNEYTVRFENADGTELQSSQVAYGQTPAYTGAEPTRAADAQYTYTFAGWKDGDGNVITGEFPAVSGDAAYTAYYTATEIVPPAQITYTVTGGAGGSWTQGSSEGYTLTVSRSEDDANCIEYYEETLIDGAVTTVTTAAGSTVVTIPAATLEGLSAGEHTVTVKFSDGEVETSLTIKAAEQETTAPEQETTAPANNTPTSPPTGDGSRPGLWIGLACAAGIACAAAAVVTKKRRA